MRRFGLLFVALALSAPAAVGGQDRPILVLNADGHTDGITAVLFTPDGKRLISASRDKTVRIWDVAGGELLRVLRPAVGPGPIGTLSAAALAPDGKTLLVCARGARENAYPIYVINLDTERIERVLDGHEKVVTGLAFSGDGKWLASGSEDATVRIWNPQTGACERTLSHRKDATTVVHALAWSPDGKRLASAGTDGVRVWAVSPGKEELWLRDAHTDGQVYVTVFVAWSPDGRTIATGSVDRTIRLWTPEGKVRQRYHDDGMYYGAGLAFTRDSRSLRFRSSLLDVATGKVRALNQSNGSSVLSPDESVVAVKQGHTLSLYTAAGTPLHRLGGELRMPVSVGWGGDGKAIGWGYDGGVPGNNELHALEQFLDLTSWEMGEKPAAPYHQAQVTRTDVALVRARPPKEGVSVVKGEETLRVLESYYYNPFYCWTFIPGSNHVLIGGNYGLYLFDFRTGQRVRAWEDRNRVLAVSPSPDGRYVLSASQDQTIRVWDLRDDQPLLSLFFRGHDWIAWTSEGYYAASPGGEKLMGWYVSNGPERMGTFYPAAQFRKALYRPDVIKRLLEAGSVEKALALADGERGRASERTEVGKVLPPRVAITAPDKAGLKLSTPGLEVRARATSVGEYPVTALRLLVDGRPYQGQAGVKRLAEPRRGAVEEAWAVQLTPGRHRLAAQADSAVSQGTSEEVEVAYVEESRPELDLPRLYVLAVGVSAYPGDLRLNYAAKDAQAVEQVFREKSRLMFQKVETRLLTDREATRGGILKGLNWLRKEMTQRDVGVFFFAGHGQKDSDGRFYLLPVDVDTDNLVATGVADDDLKKMLAGMPGRVIALLDACHAGAVGGDRRRALRALTDDLVRDLVTDDYGVVVMASAMGREFALESNQDRHGYFTLALVEALSGKAANKEGVVYLTDLDAYVTERVKELTKGRQHPVTAKPTTVRSFPLARP
jgi:WD40 repeat protein